MRHSIKNVNRSKKKNNWSKKKDNKRNNLQPCLNNKFKSNAFLFFFFSFLIADLIFTNQAIPNIGNKIITHYCYFYERSPVFWLILFLLYFVIRTIIKF